MASELTKAIFELLDYEKPTTAAGAAYMLRHDFIPLVLSAEAKQSLDWLRRNGYAKTNGDHGFGLEYLRARRE